MDKKDKYEKYVQLLEANKNLILAGAPGTGKTCMAREIAKALLLKNVDRYGDMVNADSQKVQTENRIIAQLSKKTCKMVQFHPSYDYSDFVEGLRPTMKSEDQLGFKRVNGIFKDFCIKSFDAAIIKRKSDTKGSLISHSLFGVYSEGYYEAIRNILDQDGYYGQLRYSFFSGRNK
ncbi:MAG: AAA family ATPase [Bacteroidaceae bacterium]|nr:AAA family ATPase [Bacteroidaceae bacterium]